MTAHEEVASVGQRMIWLLDRYQPSTDGRLNYPLLLRVRGPLEAGALQRAVDTVVARHESLRTTFARRRGLLTQLVAPARPVPVRTVALGPGAEDELARQARAEVSAPLDPARCTLRVTVWTLGDADRVLCLNAHHLVTDAWSSRIVTGEIVHLLSRQDVPLPRVAWQYRHFVRWQRRVSTVQRQQADGEYWREQLAGLAPLGLAKAVGSGGGSRTVQLALDGTADRVRELARAEGTTPFAVLLTFFYLALHRETGSLDLSVTVPFAGRTRPETAGTVGMFANMVVLRVALERGADFGELLRATSRTVTEAQAHQDFPFSLLELGNVGDRPDRLDDVVFQMLPELPPPARAGELEVTVVPPEIASRFDLELVVVPQPGGFRARLQHAVDRVPEDVVERLARCYQELVRGSSPATAVAGRR